MYRQKSLLEAILSGSFLARHTQNEPVERGAMTLEQRSKCAFVAGLNLLHKLLVGGVLHPHAPYSPTPRGKKV